MKTWQALVVGGVCGATVTFGVVCWSGARVAGVARGDAAAAVTSSSDKSRVPAKNEAPENTMATEGVPLEEMIARLKEWGEGRIERPAWEIIDETLRRWAEIDPHAALEFVQGVSRFPNRLEKLTVPLLALAKKDEKAAEKWMKSHLSQDALKKVLPMVVAGLASQSPSRASTLALSFPEEISLWSIGPALEQLVMVSPMEAIGYFDRLSERGQTAAAQNMLMSWARNDLDGVMDWMQQRPNVATLHLAQLAVLQTCVQTQPKRAVQFLQHAPAEFLRQTSNQMTSVVRDLLHASIDQGLEVLPLVSPDVAHAAVGHWARVHFQTSPEKTLDLVVHWVPAEKRQEVIGVAFGSWLNSDQQGARAWMATVTQPEMRATLVTGEFIWHSSRDPAAALKTWSEHSPFPDEARQAAARAFSVWSFQDAEAAAAWAVANADLVSTDQIKSAADQFLKKDEARAVTWLAGLPAGETRDVAVAGAALHWAGRMETELANQVIGSMSDPVKRLRTIFTVYRDLKKQSHKQDAAERWLESQAIDEATKGAWRREGGPG